MSAEDIKKCDACESETGLFRPVEKASSGQYIWACSEECATRLLTQLEMNFEACEACSGLGRMECQNPYCAEVIHTCEDCEGDGLQELDGEWHVELTGATVH